MLPVFGALSLSLFAAIGAAWTCDRPVRVYEHGRVIERCVTDVGGLTLLDWSDAWVPSPFSGEAAGGVAPPRYRDVLLALADQRFDGDSLAASDRFLELYGITPSPRVVLARMDDDVRHHCHDSVDDIGLRRVVVPLRFEDRVHARERRDAQGRREARLKAGLAAAGVDDPAALVEALPRTARLVAATLRDRDVQAAIDAVHGHLACEGLLPAKHADFDARTRQALALYQRRHWLVGYGELDADTRDAMVSGSPELDYRLVLRLLRQRVAEAAGLIEDGSATGVWGTVLGRQLDPTELRYRGGYAPLTDGAPDLVSSATEAAARALGWLDFAGAQANLRALVGEDAPLFAVALPPAPAYTGGRCSSMRRSTGTAPTTGPFSH